MENTDSAILKLLEAKKDNSSKEAWYPTSIEILRTNIIEFITEDNCNNNFNTTISNICYSLQYTELLVRLHEEIYLSHVLHRLINKQIIITISEIEQGLLAIKDAKLFGNNLKDEDGKRHNLSFNLRIVKANQFHYISNELKEKLLNQKSFRNRIHMRPSKDDCLITDYDAFAQDITVVDCIKGLNSLIKELSDNKFNYVMPTISEIKD